MSSVVLSQSQLFDVEEIPLDENFPISKSGNLARKFLIPPFSTLDARSGEWRKRKSAWLEVGIRSELGRGDVMKAGGVYTGESSWLGYRGPRIAAHDGADKKPKKGGRRPARALAQSINMTSLNRDMTRYESLPGTGTSIFDPVLCELIYRWYSPLGGKVLDPFAGGSVRGITAGMVGRHYLGIDLSAPQVEANFEQLETVCSGRMPEALYPSWLCGDSNEVLDSVEDEAYDLVFSCPPYADLEVYSDDPRDLSTMSYEDFVAVYRSIIEKSIRKLKPNRFACFVVGDLRGPSGAYRLFTNDTVSAFVDAGATLYNEGILLTSLGSGPVRASAHFEGNRKLIKSHQNVYVFAKGDWAEAVAACPLDIGSLAPTSWDQ